MINKEKKKKVTFHKTDQVIKAHCGLNGQTPAAVVRTTNDNTKNKNWESGHVVNSAQVGEKQFNVKEIADRKLGVSEIIGLKDGGTKISRDAKFRAENVIGESIGGKQKRENDEREGERKCETEEKEQQSWLTKPLTEIMKTAASKMLKYKCRFINDWESAKFNERWLKHYR